MKMDTSKVDTIITIDNPNAIARLTNLSIPIAHIFLSSILANKQFLIFRLYHLVLKYIDILFLTE